MPKRRRSQARSAIPTRWRGCLTRYRRASIFRHGNDSYVQRLPRSGDRVSLRQRWDIIDIPSQEDAISALLSGKLCPDSIVVGNVNTTGMGADEALTEILRFDPDLPVIISTHAKQPKSIVELVRKGAFDYVLEVDTLDTSDSPLAFTERLSLSIEKALRWRSIFNENQRLRNDLRAKDATGGIIARSEPMLKVLELARKVAPTPATVIVTGESGTGKECVARLIHNLSKVRDGSFTAVNCGSMNDQLLSSELFGHVKGAFTGAHTERPGLLREAGKGTLFLDEIGTVSPAFQIMLLRVLEQRTARAVGGSADYPVNARFIAAANRDIKSMVEAGSFREDLWYRLSVFHIHLPSLRDRPEDIPALALHFLNKACESFGRSIKGIEPAAMSRLEAHHWPGNVRQLRNVMERASIVCEKERISAGDLELSDRPPRQATSMPLPADLSYEKAMERFECKLITQTLEQAKANISKAAEILGMKRTTLHYRMRKLGIGSTVSGQNTSPLS